MPQDQTPEPEAARATLAAALERGFVTVPPAGVPPVAPEPVRRTRLVPEGNIWNMGDGVRDWTRAALSTCAAGERFEWDCSLTAAPGATGGMVTTYVLVIYTPSPLLGHAALGAARIIGDNPGKDIVTEHVRAAVDELRTRRSEVLNSLR